MNYDKIGFERGLMNAVQKENLDFVKFFLEKGADKNIPDKNGRIPLEEAIKKGNLEIVKQLFTPEDVNKKFKNTNTPLIEAAVEGNLDLVNFFFDNGANPSLKNSEYKTARYFLKGWGQIQKDDEGKKLYAAAMNRLEKEEENVNNFLNAVRAKEIDKVKEFIGKVNIDVVDDDGNSALLIAVRQNATDIVKLLVEKGADSFLFNSKGWLSSVEVAINDGNLEIIKLLIIPANVNKKFYDDVTPLMYAIRYQKLDIVKFLVEQGADINKPDEAGSPPLMRIVELGDIAMVKFFLEKGADVSLKNSFGKNARERAMEILERFENDDAKKVKFQQIIDLLVTKEKEFEQLLISTLQKLTEELQMLEIKIKGT